MMEKYRELCMNLQNMNSGGWKQLFCVISNYKIPNTSPSTSHLSLPTRLRSPPSDLEIRL